MCVCVSFVISSFPFLLSFLLTLTPLPFCRALPFFKEASLKLDKECSTPLKEHGNVRFPIFPAHGAPPVSMLWISNLFGGLGQSDLHLDQGSQLWE